MSTELVTGYNIRAGSKILAERFAGLDLCTACSEPRISGRCLNIGECFRSHETASAQSLRKGSAASSRPAAWTLGGRVD